MKKLGQWFDSLWNWTVYSSANPGQISSTIKWGGGILATLLTVTLGFGHITFPDADWTSLIDSLIQAVQDVVLAVSAIGTVIAAGRKIWLSLRGQNAAVQPKQ